MAFKGPFELKQFYNSVNNSIITCRCKLKTGILIQLIQDVLQNKCGFFFA